MFVDISLAGNGDFRSLPLAPDHGLMADRSLSELNGHVRAWALTFSVENDPTGHPRVPIQQDHWVAVSTRDHEGRGFAGCVPGLSVKSTIEA